MSTTPAAWPSWDPARLDPHCPGCPPKKSRQGKEAAQSAPALAGGARLVQHVLLHKEGQVVGDGQQDLLRLLLGQVGQQPGREFLALLHTQELQEFILCLPGDEGSIGTDPQGPVASLSIQKDKHHLQWRTRLMARVSPGHGDTRRRGSSPPCDPELLIHDHLSPARTRTCCPLLSPHCTNSLFTAASLDFQRLVDTLHFLALLFLTAGLLLFRGQGHLPPRLLHFQQLHKELENPHGVRRQPGASSACQLSRTSAQADVPSQSSSDENRVSASPRLALNGALLTFSILCSARSRWLPAAFKRGERKAQQLQPAPDTAAGRVLGQLLPGDQRQLQDTEQSHREATASSNCPEPHPTPWQGTSCHH